MSAFLDDADSQSNGEDTSVLSSILLRIFSVRGSSGGGGGPLPVALKCLICNKNQWFYSSKNVNVFRTVYFKVSTISVVTFNLVEFGTQFPTTNNLYANLQHNQSI